MKFRKLSQKRKHNIKRGGGNALLNALDNTGHFDADEFLRKAREHNQLECVICLSQIEDDEEICFHYGKMQVPHIFHSVCINNWLKKESTCPICREVIYDWQGINGGECQGPPPAPPNDDDDNYVAPEPAPYMNTQEYRTASQRREELQRQLYTIPLPYPEIPLAFYNHLGMPQNDHRYIEAVRVERENRENSENRERIMSEVRELTATLSRIQEDYLREHNPIRGGKSKSRRTRKSISRRTKTRKSRRTRKGKSRRKY